eukprot:TRINITY_DN433_c0_g1_i1.p2 TRINITY_DN433_c0_g1~~TRINITY_DN433_c0_g1_i1.p2  ORF type:complete len:336 (+),score=86.23 TRINITY_DN433_c0_g1_i1:1409-2416(+)
METLTQFMKDPGHSDSEATDAKYDPFADMSSERRRKHVSCVIDEFLDSRPGKEELCAQGILQSDSFERLPLSKPSRLSCPPGSISASAVPTSPKFQRAFRSASCVRAGGGAPFTVAVSAMRTSPSPSPTRPRGDSEADQKSAAASAAELGRLLEEVSAAGRERRRLDEEAARHATEGAARREEERRIAEEYITKLTEERKKLDEAAQRLRTERRTTALAASCADGATAHSELCVVCGERPAGALLLPCGHARFCAECVGAEAEAASDLGSESESPPPPPPPPEDEEVEAQAPQPQPPTLPPRRPEPAPVVPPRPPRSACPICNTTVQRVVRFALA